MPKQKYTEENEDEYFESHVYPRILDEISAGTKRATKEGIEAQKRIALKREKIKQLLEAKKLKEQKPKKLDTKSAAKQIKEAKMLYNAAMSGKIDLDESQIKKLKKMANEKYSKDELDMDRAVVLSHIATAEHLLKQRTAHKLEESVNTYLKDLKKKFEKDGNMYQVYKMKGSKIEFLGEGPHTGVIVKIIDDSIKQLCKEGYTHVIKVSYSIETQYVEEDDDPPLAVSVMIIPIKNGEELFKDTIKKTVYWTEEELKHNKLKSTDFIMIVEGLMSGKIDTDYFANVSREDLPNYKTSASKDEEEEEKPKAPKRAMSTATVVKREPKTTMKTAVVVKREPKFTMKTAAVVKSEPKPKKITKAQQARDQESEMLRKHHSPEAVWKRELLGLMGTLSVYMREMEKAKDEVKFISKDAYDAVKDIRDTVAHAKKSYEHAKEKMKDDIKRIKQLYKIGMQKEYTTQEELIELLNKRGAGESIEKLSKMRKGRYF